MDQLLPESVPELICALIIIAVVIWALKGYFDCLDWRDIDWATHLMQEQQDIAAEHCAKRMPASHRAQMELQGATEVEIARSIERGMP